jgi:hypothetical protein
MRRTIILVWLVFGFEGSNIASTYSQALEAQAQALSLITDIADEICGIISHAGNSQSLKVKGEVKAQLNGLIRQLADLGIAGAIDYSVDQYQEVIQSDLAATIQRNADCKLRVFDKLQEKMIK